jgi:hypothetical protein
MGHDLNSWHLDKRVPISIIIGLVVQTFIVLNIGVSWKNDIGGPLKNVESRQEQNNGNRDRILVLEQRLTFIENSLVRIEKKLDQIGDRKSNE